MEIQLNPTVYNGGYHVRCHGDNNGSVTTVLIGGEEPFSFLWNTGSTQQSVTNLYAGTYTITVTQNGGVTQTASITLNEPHELDPGLYSPTFQGGTNISVNGGNDGSIELTDQGGTPPYTFMWSNSSEEQNLYTLTAGTYTVTVTDMNACTKTKSITLTEPAVLSLVSITSPQYNGYNLHCNAGLSGEPDGSIDITVTGGTPPYAYQWDNGSFDEDPVALTAGDYAVRITDANNVEIEGSITLTQPPLLELSLSAFEYPNGYNISIFGDYNGSITTTAGGGITPYTFSWSDGATTQNRGNIGFGNYTIEITDANGCLVSSDITLSQPAREGWALGGNTGIDTSTQFIGTADSTSISFRTNDLERMRITVDGKLKIKGLEDTIQGLDLLFVDAHGVVQKGHKICSTSGILPWVLDGNFISSPVGTSPPPQKIGTCNDADFTMITNAIEQVRITISGNVGIGNTIPLKKLSVNGDAEFLGNKFQILYGNTAIPDDRGIALQTTGYFNFYVNSTLSNASFHFRDENNTASPELLSITKAAHVGIGNVTPEATLQIGADFVLNKGSAATSLNHAIGYNFYYSSNATNYAVANKPASCVAFNEAGDITFKNAVSGTGALSWNPAQTIIFNDGRVYIGEGSTSHGYYHTNIPPTNEDYFLLSVEGKIISTEIRVKTKTNWPDYVFDQNYKLLSLEQTEEFIKKNHHLPDLPPASQIEREGHDLGKMDALLLKKIEELTLYVIELKAKNDEQSKALAGFKKQLDIQVY